MVMVNDSISIIVRWHACNMTVIPWVECLLAIRFACGVPRLYRFSYPMPFRSVSVCGFLFLFFVLFVFRISVRPMSQATQCKQKITTHSPTQCAARAQKCCSHECNFLIPTAGTVFDIAKPLDHPRRRFFDQKNRSDPVVFVRAGANPARHSFVISGAPTGLVGRKLLAYEQLSRCALSKG